MNKIALALAVTACTLAACGSTDDVDNVDDGVDVIPVDDAAAEALTIDTIDAYVSACLCRCTTPTSTQLTVHGAGFVDGAVVTVDGTKVSSWVSDRHTIEVSLWASPAPGEHELVVEVLADDVDATSNASFMMPEPDQEAEERLAVRNRPAARLPYALRRRPESENRVGTSVSISLSAPTARAATDRTSDL
jgi:hypothetical protein